ncbi:type VI secretion system contractile sheath large subunit [Roseomonas sp. PWR1]|uniref:Type VI secretion system contractile sheath large subunit n=1 Tax=Roseomonas nitratireducens TaxID=2820810 RepID=A0ABS4APJ1_9PROT|nr:type VI secretion system contractile sheath large subunit [Neoroseomonas nitratireducens]MBP0463154.1 type VI secretion system contractile sheath large subunit [Neoroseomonas nitratireducens]
MATDSDDTGTAARAAAALAWLEARIDALSAGVLGDPRLLALEARWRGLHRLVAAARGERHVALRLLDAPDHMLRRDLARAERFDRTLVFKRVHDDVFGIDASEPFSLLLVDIAWSDAAEDVAALAAFARIAAASPALCLTQAAPAMFGLADWREARTAEAMAEAPLHRRADWLALRDMPEARHLALALPRALVRVGDAPARHCWLPAAWLVAASIVRSAADLGVGTWMWGHQGGGRIADLPTADLGPAPDGRGDRRSLDCRVWADTLDLRLGSLGFVPVTQDPPHLVPADAELPAAAVIFSAPSLHRPRRYEDPAVSADAAIAARLWFALSVVQVLHALKLIARDGRAAGRAPAEIEARLARWVAAQTGERTPTRLFPLLEGAAQLLPPGDGAGPWNVRLMARPPLGMAELSRPFPLTVAVPVG